MKKYIVIQAFLYIYTDILILPYHNFSIYASSFIKLYKNIWSH
jgi:hypothetical protein